MDFFRREPRVQWKFNLGIPLYYYLLGRRSFGRGMKYPLWRLAHLPEQWLRRKLYLDFSGRMTPRYSVPEHVEIPHERQRPSLPDLVTLGGPRPAPLPAD
jgi:hypothetical protein